MAIEHMKGKLISQLPVQSERDYQLEINMKTANSIGVTIPDNLKALASKIYSE
jgi:hypothetical protein